MTGKAYKKPSLKAQWKNAMRALDRLDADVNARAVYTALWAYTDTDTVDVAHAVALVYPKVSTIRDLIGVRSDKTVLKALDWLVERGLIWRVRPKRGAKLPGRLFIGKAELHRGVCVYAWIAGATDANRTQWARNALAKGLDIDGGPSWDAAVTASAAAPPPAATTAAPPPAAEEQRDADGHAQGFRVAVVNQLMHAAMDGGLARKNMRVSISARINAAATKAPSEAARQALYRLDRESIFREVDHIMRTGPSRDLWIQYGTTKPPRGASRTTARA